MLKENLPTALVIAFAVAAMSFTIAKTKVSAPFRAFVKSKSEWLGGLVSCPYCTSHWLTLAAVLTFRGDIRLIWGHGFFDYMGTWAAIIGLSAIIVGQINNAIQPPLAALAPAQNAGWEPPARVKH